MGGPLSPGSGVRAGWASWRCCVGFLWVLLGPAPVRCPLCSPAALWAGTGVQQRGGAERDREGWSTRGHLCSGHWAGGRPGHRPWEGGRARPWCACGLVTVWLCTQRDSLASVGRAPDRFFVSKGQCGGPGAVCVLVSSGPCQEQVWRTLWPAWLYGSKHSVMVASRGALPEAPGSLCRLPAGSWPRADLPWVTSFP